MTSSPGQPLPPSPQTARELAARLAAERVGVPFLLFRDGGGEQQIISLHPGRLRMTLGRDEANDIPLSWDHEVSRAHAELEWMGGHWTINDDGLSRNGTFVNGLIVRGRRRLGDGDCVRVGRSVLLFSLPGTGGGSVTTPAAGVADGVELSPMQRRILAALCRPLVAGTGGPAAPASNREIAEIVHLSVEGVKAQLRTLCERFGITDLPQNQKRLVLAERALRAGLGAAIRE